MGRLSACGHEGLAGMLTHVYADGRLGCIQQTGAEPAPFKATASYNYGVGAFLMAGSEIRRMGATPAPEEGSQAKFEPGPGCRMILSCNSNCAGAVNEGGEGTRRCECIGSALGRWGVFLLLRRA